MLRTVLVVGLVASTTACGDRLISVDPDGGAPGRSPDSATPNPDASLPMPDAPQTTPTCVIAIRVDDCCTVAKAHTQTEVDADPCLVLWPSAVGMPQASMACVAKWPKECELVDCTFSGPPSRVVALKEGTCQFQDECQSNADCAIATDTKQCCACPLVYPRALLEQGVCLNEVSQPWGIIPDECVVNCTSVVCAQCLPPAGVECLQYDDELTPSVCVAVN